MNTAVKFALTGLFGLGLGITSALAQGASTANRGCLYDDKAYSIGAQVTLGDMTVVCAASSLGGPQWQASDDNPAARCVFAEQEYSWGASIGAPNGATQTCNSNGTWSIVGG